MRVCALLELPQGGLEDGDLCFVLCARDVVSIGLSSGAGEANDCRWKAQFRQAVMAFE